MSGLSTSQCLQSLQKSNPTPLFFRLTYVKYDRGHAGRIVLMHSDRARPARASKGFAKFWRWPPSWKENSCLLPTNARPLRIPALMSQPGPQSAYPRDATPRIFDLRGGGLRSWQRRWGAGRSTPASALRNRLVR
jgi:hypothetical protein